MKIVYVTNNITIPGGLQKVTILKANALAEIEGNDISIIVPEDGNEAMIQPLSPKVNIISLGVNYNKISWNNTIKSLLEFKSKRLYHFKVLRNVLNEINPDIVVSTGKIEKKMIVSMKHRTWKTVLEYHFEKNYDFLLCELSGQKSWLDKLRKKRDEFYEKRYDKIVVLTESDRVANWKGWDNVTVIPNPVTFNSTKCSALDQKCIVSIGRLVKTKNFQSLIRCFQLVLKKYPDWVLKIYGEGEERSSLERMISQECLNEKVFLCGITLDVKKSLLESSIFAFTSLSEGYSLALLEAMECGVPVVSYDCPYGPREIITDKTDGFLVPVNDEISMVERMCILIEDGNRRKQMGKAAKTKAQSFNIKSIAERWVLLFNQLVEG